MKKESSVIEEKNVYNLEVLIKNTAYAKSVTGKTGLINIKSNEVVGSFDYFFTIYSRDDAFYFQEKRVEDRSKGSLETKIYVRIYDALNEKTVANNWLVVYPTSVIRQNYYQLAILQDPDTHKYHLFDMKNYRTALNIFENEFDEVKYLYYYFSDTYFSVSKNGKKALYSTKKGLVTPYEYDNIQRIGPVTVFTQGNQSFFTCLNDSKGTEFKSPLYDDIKCDMQDSNLIYCKRNSTIAVYYYAEQGFCKQLFTIPNCDDIECLRKIEDSDFNSLSLEYIFSVKKNHKYGLLSKVVNKAGKNKAACKSLTKIEYDGIKYKSGDYFLEKGNKKGLFVGTAENNHFIKANYDNIIPIGGSNYYELFDGENCSIINLFDQSVVISDCKIIQNTDSSVIYEKDGKKAIFCTPKGNTFLSSEYYDDIEYLGHRYYLVTRNGKKGILYGIETLIEPRYESIEIDGYRPYKGYDLLNFSNVLYFALKKADGNYDMAKWKNQKYGKWDKNGLEFLNVRVFNDISFYDSIMVFRDHNRAYVYSYDEKLLKTYPANVNITTATVKSGQNEIDLYIVDGVYYLYTNGNFEKAPIEDCKLYVTVYEGDNETVVINSYDKKQHDEICDQIEDGGEENIDQTVALIYEKDPRIKHQYPPLIKRLKPNKKNSLVSE